MWNYPPFVWAKDISVTIGIADLEVSGVVPVLLEDHDGAPDPLRAYRDAVRCCVGRKRRGKNSPHIQFANATNRLKQITFVKQYGPVIVSSSRTQDRVIPSKHPFDFEISEQIIFARQNLAELDREQLIFRAALSLISELRRGKASNLERIQLCASAIGKFVSYWPGQWERERQLRTKGQDYLNEPLWFFGPDNLQRVEIWESSATHEPTGDPMDSVLPGADPIYASHLLICELINAFAPTVYPWGDVPVEAPGWSLVGGIRPILYYILRREYLQGGGVGICQNSDCRSLFEIERNGQQFCEEQCSRLHRQREYWGRRGKKLRKRRLKAGAKRGISAPSDPKRKRNQS